MIILGIDTTTLACSVALLNDRAVLAEMTLNIEKTHSERLMPLVDRLLVESGLEREGLQAVAAAAGPGSFTGLRIGVATARGLAQGLDIPAVPVCTLTALAESVPAPGYLLCPLLDARRNQVYTALFRHNGPSSEDLETVLEPAALALEELIERLRDRGEGVIFLGEGLNTFARPLKEALPDLAVLTPAPFRLCRASLVALNGRRLLREKPGASYTELLPRYLRRPEAERLAAQKKEDHDDNGK